MIRKLDLRPEGVVATLRSGQRMLYAFGVIGIEQVDSVHVAPDGMGIVIELRSGDQVERSLDSMQPMAGTDNSRGVEN